MDYTFYLDGTSEGEIFEGRLISDDGRVVVWRVENRSGVINFFGDDDYIKPRLQEFVVLVKHGLKKLNDAAKKA